MPPEGYVPRWEKDFWDTLMEEQHVTLPGGWSVPKEKFYGVPDKVFEEAAGVSRFDNGNVIVGEIVEERKELV